LQQDKLRSYILNSKENDCFDYYDDDSVKKITNSYDEAGSKQDRWMTIFIQNYARIKHKHGIPDPNNKDGKIVYLLYDRKKYMAVFFIPEPNGRYTIYDFKIAPLSQIK
jgi:hypothetical protein